MGSNKDLNIFNWILHFRPSSPPSYTTYILDIFNRSKDYIYFSTSSLIFLYIFFFQNYILTFHIKCYYMLCLNFKVKLPFGSITIYYFQLYYSQFCVNLFIFMWSWWEHPGNDLNYIISAVSIRFLCFDVKIKVSDLWRNACWASFL